MSDWIRHLELLAEEAKKDGPLVWSEVILDYEKETLQLVNHAWHLPTEAHVQKWLDLKFKTFHYFKDAECSCLSVKLGLTPGPPKRGVFFEKN